MVISDSSQKIGIFGGSFDPVHNGHMAAAELALTALGLDQLRFIPCHLPNPDYKQALIASPAQRLRMLSLVSQANPKLIVDELELQRGQTSYSFDTLIQLRSNFADADRVLILGVDSFNSLPSWYRWRELLELVHVLILSRPGYGIDPATAIACGLDQRQVSKPADLFVGSGGNILFLDSLEVNVSSSMLRGKISQGESLAGLVDDKVLDYIHEQGLYQQSTAQ